MTTRRCFRPALPAVAPHGSIAAKAHCGNAYADQAMLEYMELGPTARGGSARAVPPLTNLRRGLRGSRRKPGRAAADAAQAP